MQIDKETFWAELEQEGEDNIREWYHTGLYGGYKKKYVELWLREKDRTLASRIGSRKERKETITVIAAVIAAVAATIGATASIITLLSE